MTPDTKVRPSESLHQTNTFFILIYIGLMVRRPPHNFKAGGSGLTDSIYGDLCPWYGTSVVTGEFRVFFIYFT